MHKPMSLLLQLVLLLAVSACCSSEDVQAIASSQQVPTGGMVASADAAAVKPDGGGTREDTVPGMALVHSSVDGVSLEVKVEKVTCKSDRGELAEVRVKWTVPEGVSFTRISAASPGQEAKTWVEAGASGEEVTGEWVGDGTALVLHDASTQAVLARITAEATSCAGQ
jgi:hypothetical protein